MSARDLELQLTIPADLNRRIHELPHGAETLGEKILRLLEFGVLVQEQSNELVDQLRAEFKEHD